MEESFECLFFSFLFSLIPFSDHHLRADLRSPPDVDLDPFGFLESIDDDIEISADLERFVVVLNRLFRQKKKKKKKGIDLSIFYQYF